MQVKNDITFILFCENTNGCKEKKGWYTRVKRLIHFRGRVWNIPYDLFEEVQYSASPLDITKSYTVVLSSSCGIQQKSLSKREKMFLCFFIVVIIGLYVVTTLYIFYCWRFTLRPEKSYFCSNWMKSSVEFHHGYSWDLKAHDNSSYSTNKRQDLCRKRQNTRPGNNVFCRCLMILMKMDFIWVGTHSSTLQSLNLVPRVSIG